LKPLLSPSSVAVIGASRNPASVGHGVLKGLVKGSVFASPFAKPFKGRIFAVNPNASEILGVKCIPSVKDAAGPVDLAVICVPAALVPTVLRECAEKKVKAAIVVSAGFAETGPEGRQKQEEIAAICRNAGMLLLGPNCLGVLRPASSLNASFGLGMPPSGGMAFVSQSGALADSVIDWALEQMYGFSALVSLGNSAGLNEADFVDWLASDAQTKAITLYLEGVRNGKAFMAAVRKAVANDKKVFVLKGGREGKGLKAVSSHTAAMAGSYPVFAAAMRQCGATVVDSLEELFVLGDAASKQPAARNGVAVITNGGGAGVLCADYCHRYGVQLVDLREKTLARLDRGGNMHSAYSRSNPLDLIGDALPERYAAALETLLSENYVHGLIVVQTLQTMTDSIGDAKAVVAASRRHPKKPVLCVFMGGPYSKEGICFLHEHGIPNFQDPLLAVKAMAALVGKI